MGFNSAVGLVEIIATDEQTDFNFVFKIYKDTDLDVRQLSGANPYITLILGTDYTVSINGDNGGVVTLVTAAKTDDTLILRRDLPAIREVEYFNGGDLSPDVLNADQNYQTYLLADSSISSMSGVFYHNKEGYEYVSTEMPIPAKGNLIGWNDAGDALENKDSSGGGGDDGCCQFLGTDEVKAIGYVSNSTKENLVLENGVTGYTVDSFTIEDGGSLTIRAGSVFKIL